MPKKRDWQESVKKMIREAVTTMHNLPATGTRPGGYGSTMPDIVRDMSEAYGYDAVVIGRVAPTAAQIDRLDIVLQAMASPDLDPESRSILWARGANVRWGKLERVHKKSRMSLWRIYDRALAEFALRIIEGERKAA